MERLDVVTSQEKFVSISILHPNSMIILMALWVALLQIETTEWSVWSGHMPCITYVAPVNHCNCHSDHGREGVSFMQLLEEIANASESIIVCDPFSEQEFCKNQTTIQRAIANLTVWPEQHELLAKGTIVLRLMQ